ncbi:hypothetical protein FHR67_002403 [Xanthomonas arboricola]|nr:hypothetical protein [Xanthomonas campestris]
MGLTRSAALQGRDTKPVSLRPNNVEHCPQSCTDVSGSWISHSNRVSLSS